MISQRKAFFTSLGLIGLLILISVVHYLFFLRECEQAPAELRTPQEYNAYLAKNHQFDSAIFGSSLSMCFRCSDFDRVCGGYSYKLTVPGCEVPVWTAMARFVDKHRKLRAVLADVHLNLLLVPAKNMDYVDEYYSDWKFLMDVKAGASVKTIRMRRLFYLEKFSNRGKKEEPFSRDDIYDWSGKYPCGKMEYAKRFFSHTSPFDAKRKKSRSGQNPNIGQNLEPLVVFIRENPQIKFYLYLPPYSALAYDDAESFLSARKAVMDQLLAFPNVELYDFQSADFVTDFDNYMDLTHFSREISAWMLKQMSEKNYLVTPDNRALFEKKFSDRILAYDREKAIAELKAFYEQNAAENGAE